MGKRKFTLFLQKIKEILCKNNTDIKLIDFIKEYAEERRRPGEKNYQGRCGSVLTLVKHIEAFGAKDVKIKNIKVDFCKRFVEYLYTAQDLHRGMKSQKGLSENTIHLKCSILKAVLQEAVRQHLIKENAMNYLPHSYRTKLVKKEKCNLSLEELQKMSQIPCPTPLLKEAFIFSCLTGLRKSDVLDPKPSDIYQQEEGFVIHKKIKKTKQWLTIPLSQIAQNYLPSTPKNNNSYFSCLSSNNISHKLRSWAQKNQITQKPINFHTARHTFASLELALGADIYTVSQLLGHSNITTTMMYSKASYHKKAKAITLLDKLSI